jgi:hypothetical protein
VEGVLDTLDELNDPADGQHRRLAHSLRWRVRRVFTMLFILLARSRPCH